MTNEHIDEIQFAVDTLLMAALLEFLELSFFGDDFEIFASGIKQLSDLILI